MGEKKHDFQRALLSGCLAGVGGGRREELPVSSQSRKGRLGLACIPASKGVFARSSLLCSGEERERFPPLTSPHHPFFIGRRAPEMNKTCPGGQRGNFLLLFFFSSFPPPFFFLNYHSIKL